MQDRCAPREPVIAGNRRASLAEWILEPRVKRHCRGLTTTLTLSYTLRLFPVNGTEGIAGLNGDTNKGGTTAFSSLAEEGFFYV